MRRILGADDDDRACQLHRREDVLLQVGRTGRKVHDQVVDVAPTHVSHQLIADERREHRWHRERLRFGQEEAAGHPPYIRDLDWLQLDPPEAGIPADVPATQLACLLQAQHQRDVRSVDVCVQQANPATASGQRPRQAEAHRGLPYASFATGNRDELHTGHSGDRLRRRRYPPKTASTSGKPAKREKVPLPAISSAAARKPAQAVRASVPPTLIRRTPSPAACATVMNGAFARRLTGFGATAATTADTCSAVPIPGA